jgi:hypothetical protein
MILRARAPCCCRGALPHPKSFRSQVRCCCSTPPLDGHVCKSAWLLLRASTLTKFSVLDQQALFAIFSVLASCERNRVTAASRRLPFK